MPCSGDISKTMKDGKPGGAAEDGGAGGDAEEEEPPLKGVHMLRQLQRVRRNGTWTEAGTWAVDIWLHVLALLYRYSTLLYSAIGWFE